MMPFLIMVIVQRLGLLFLNRLPVSVFPGDLAAFLTASAAGIFFFRMSCGSELLRLRNLPPADTGEEYDPPVPPFPGRDTPFGIVMYILVAAGALIAAMYAASTLIGGQSSDLPDSRILTAEFVSLVLIHPILEEYIFRWLYYRELRPMHPFFAGLAQAVMFAIVHGSVGGMICALFSGVILAVVLERSGSLSAAVIPHMLINLRSFVYLVWLTEAAQVRMMIDFGIVSLSFAAFLALLVRRGLRETWNSAAGKDKTDDRE